LLGELPKSFGKTFAVGYLLPAVAISIVILLIFETFGVNTHVPALFENKDVIGATFLTFAIWLFAVALMALNYPIIRLLEGYGRFNPFHLVGWRLTAEFRELRKSASSAEKTIGEAYAANKEPDPADIAQITDALDRLAAEYPDDEKWLLPTRFGNVIRAFEVYPRVIYGLDSIPAWDRLIAVIPKDFREAIDDARSLMDFWVNLWIGSVIVSAIYFTLAIVNSAAPRLWIPSMALAFSLFTAVAARMLAGNWGALIKSAFDIYRSDLADKLKLNAPRSAEHERAMWQLVSQVMIYRSSAAADRITQYRKHDVK